MFKQLQQNINDRKARTDTTYMYYTCIIYINMYIYVQCVKGHFPANCTRLEFAGTLERI